jgi:hypothetical protein
VALTHCTPLATKGGVIILESMTHPSASVTKTNVLNMFRVARITLQKTKERAASVFTPFMLPLFYVFISLYF